MNILDNVEKVESISEELVKNKKEKNTSVLLAITYKDGQQELFSAEKEAAIEAVIEIDEILVEGNFPTHIVLNNKKVRNDCVGENIQDFKGLIVIDETIRAVRLIDPEIFLKED